MIVFFREMKLIFSSANVTFRFMIDQICTYFKIENLFN